jgi:cation diffusion facilitator family transporter
MDTEFSVPQAQGDAKALKLAMALSLWIGILMFLIKVGAYLITGSAAILSDAAESVVHVAAVGFAAYSLRLTQRPADDCHLYGHTKIGFFSAGFEGALIGLAAIYIIYAAVTKWLTGLELENLGLGTGLTAVAAVINGGLGAYLVRVGKKRNSLILVANGKHVLTDCWTSVGVLIGLGLTLVTGWLPWDPICAIFVAVNILVSGIGLVRQSVAGLMDRADPQVQARLEHVLDGESERHGIAYHGLRHRNLGTMHWVDLHLLFSGDTPVQKAHEIATQVEHQVRQSLPAGAYVEAHLEALEDHAEVHPEGHHRIG